MPNIGVMNTHIDQSRCTPSVHGDLPWRNRSATAESGAGAKPQRASKRAMRGGIGAAAAYMERMLRLQPTLRRRRAASHDTPTVNPTRIVMCGHGFTCTMSTAFNASALRWKLGSAGAIDCRNFGRLATGNHRPDRKAIGRY